MSKAKIFEPHQMIAGGEKEFEKFQEAIKESVEDFAFKEFQSGLILRNKVLRLICAI